MLTALRTARPIFQATPDPDARALPTRYGLDDEREWLRSALPAEFAAAWAEVTGLLRAGHPGFRPSSDTLADAAAVRLYLGALGEGLDAVLRRGEPGPQVPFARCVASGLGRLPAYRGATLLAAGLTAADRAAVRERGILTDWGFTQTLTEPSGDLPGPVDVLIWSLTARRTRLLEPPDGHRVEARAVFLPGTAFKVLSAPTTGPVLLREVAADELPHGNAPFDDFTVAALRRAVERWLTTGPSSVVGPGATARFTAAPGMFPGPQPG